MKNKKVFAVYTITRLKTIKKACWTHGSTFYHQKSLENCLQEEHIKLNFQNCRNSTGRNERNTQTPLKQRLRGRRKKEEEEEEEKKKKRRRKEDNKRY
ncbi:hypothetical protein M0813_13328 [Anaeramoeba flamelloides]|uniref:Uncharacterized protein n=1 Tax=Anaeramoeba flamelloides TaxID=1746091 RepID=A0ABQ8ZAJ8_9EUKA|nr:hypothetical protein M0813_13328 [Anaeramoeba flamelloides]